MGSERSDLWIQKLFYTSMMAGMATLILLSIMSVAIVVVAQIPSTPTDENGGGAQQSPIADNPSSTNNASNIAPPTIEITSHEDGQEVPVGELTIGGTSSDDQEINCQVYADVNDMTPMQNATAAGNSAEDSDFSKWTFTYKQDYQEITEGSNELTAKVSCFDANSLTPASEWHSINVTGAATATSSITEEPRADDGTTSSEEAPSIGEEGDIGLDDIMPGVPPSG